MKSRNETENKQIKFEVMLTAIIPKLPMRDISATKAYYLNKLGFTEITDYGNYLLISKDNTEIHFFEFRELDPKENYGQVYIRTNDIESLYHSLQDKKVEIHPNSSLHVKPWGQIEFSLLDPDNNLLTFGQVASQRKETVDPPWI